MDIIFTQFKIACVHGEVEEVESILSHCPCVIHERHDRKYQLIMESLCRREQTPQRVEIFKLIYKMKYASVKTNIIGHFQAVFLQACRDECLELVKFMMNENNAQNEFSQQMTLNRIFLTLCTEGQVETIRLLLQISDIEPETIKRGFTEACLHARLNVVKLFFELMDQEEPPDALPTADALKQQIRTAFPCRRGYALHCVIHSCRHLVWKRESQHEILKLLARRGFPMDSHDGRGITPLGNAAATCHYETVSLLIELKCNVNTFVPLGTGVPRL